MDMETQLKIYYRQIGSQQFNPADLDYTILNYHLPFLERLDSIEKSSVAVFDLYRMKYQFITNKFKYLAGYDRDQALAEGIDYFFRLMHPADLPHVLDTSLQTMSFLFDLPPAERKDYKLSFDFRIRKADGNYLRMIQQVVVLELDKSGKIWLVMAINDIAPYNDDTAKIRRQLVNMKSGEFYLFPTETKEASQKPVLSHREIEILGLIAQGYLSKEIADKLFISVNTVNNHRQKILAKMNVANSSEAVKYAAGLGLV